MITFFVAVPLSKNDVIAGQNGGDGNFIFGKCSEINFRTSKYFKNIRVHERQPQNYIFLAILPKGVIHRTK